MRIVYISGSPYLGIGGIPQVVRKVSQWMAARGHEVSVFAFKSESQEPSILEDEGVRVFLAARRSWPILGGLSVSFVLNLKKNSRTIAEADVIHIHGYHTLVSLQSLLLISDKPVVFTAHHGLGHSIQSDILHALYRPLGSILFRKAKAVVFVSEHERRVVEHRFGRMAEGYTIPHGVDQVIAEAGSVRHISRDSIGLVYVGLVYEYKGIQNIVSSMRVLMDRHGVSPRLRIVGTGPYEKILRQLAARLDLEERVQWLGPLVGGEVSDVIVNSDLLVLLSKVEGYGLVVAEALALGVPCLVSSDSALAEFCEVPGCYGISSSSDPATVAGKIALLMGRDVTVGPVPRTKIRTWSQAASDHEKLYEGILTHGRQQSRGSRKW